MTAVERYIRVDTVTVDTVRGPRERYTWECESCHEAGPRRPTRELHDAVDAARVHAMICTDDFDVHVVIHGGLVWCERVTATGTRWHLRRLAPGGPTFPGGGIPEGTVTLCGVDLLRGWDLHKTDHGDIAALHGRNCHPCETEALR